MNALRSLALTFVILLQSCAHTAHREAYVAPAEEKTLSDEQEYRLGRQVTAGLLGQFPLKEGEINSYLTLLARYLAQFSLRPTTFKGYRAVLVQSKEKAAFSTPGGFILVSEGLLEVLESEDELAGVLAHEIAHVGLRHGELALEQGKMAEGSRKKTSKMLRVASGLLGGLSGSKTDGALVDAAGIAQGASKAYDSHGGEIHEQLMNSGYSQDQEYAADGGTAKILIDAGYDPAIFAQFLARTYSTEKPLKAKSIEGLVKGTFLSTHPLDERRVERLKNIILGWRPGPQSPARLRRFEAAKSGARAQ